MADIDLIELLNGVDISGGSARARATAAAALAAVSGIRGSAEDPRGRSPSPGGRGGARAASGSPMPPRIAEGVFRDERGIPTDRFLEALKRDPALVLQKLEDHCASEWKRAETISSRANKDRNPTAYASTAMNAPVGVQERPMRDTEADARMRRLDEIVQRPQSSQYGDLGRRRSSGDVHERPTPAAGRTNAVRRPYVRYASLSDGENSGYDDSDSEDCMESHSLELDGPQYRRSPKKAGHNKGKKGILKMKSKGDSSRFHYENDGIHSEDRGQLMTASHQPVSTAGETEELKKKVAREKLRIAGQLQTIRTLEVKLSQAEHGVKERDLEISSLRSKLQQAEKRELALGGRPIPSTIPAAVARVYSNPVTPKLSTTPSKVEEREAIRKLKAEVVQLQERLRDSNIRMQQSNERHKIVKSAFDRLKVDFEEQKAGKSKLEVSLSDTQNALIKCRRDLKDAHNKIDGLMADISAYADSERRSKEEVKLAHSAIQKLESECERYRRDLVRQGTDIAYLQENSRRMELELRLLRDRDTSRAVVATKSALRGSREGSEGSESPVRSSLRRARADSSGDFHGYDEPITRSRPPIHSSSRSGSVSPPRPALRRGSDEDIDIASDGGLPVDTSRNTASTTRRAHSASPHRPTKPSTSTHRPYNEDSNNSLVDWDNQFKLHQKANASTVAPGSRVQGSSSRPPLYRDSHNHTNTTSFADPTKQQRSPPRAAHATRPSTVPSSDTYSRHFDSNPNDSSHHSNSALFNQSSILSMSHHSLNNSLEQTKLKHDKLQQMYERITRNKGQSVNPMRNSHDL